MRFSDGVAEADLYALLGVTDAASAAEVRRGYRSEAKRWHPDRNHDIYAQARMVAINNAFAVLRNSDRRQEYDRSQVRTTHETTNDSQSQRQGSARGTRTTPEGRPEPRPRQRARVASLVSYCRNRGLEVIDNRSKGGALWILAGKELEPTIDRLRQNGFRFTFAPKGGRATSRKSAWWTKTSG
jgi:curved DNA-binding protein CbpA